jgi:hypothetical protein
MVNSKKIKKSGKVIRKVTHQLGGIRKKKTMKGAGVLGTTKELFGIVKDIWKSSIIGDALKTFREQLKTTKLNQGKRSGNFNPIEANKTNIEKLKNDTQTLFNDILNDKTLLDKPVLITFCMNPEIYSTNQQCKSLIDKINLFINTSINEFLVTGNTHLLSLDIGQLNQTNQQIKSVLIQIFMKKLMPLLKPKNPAQNIITTSTGNMSFKQLFNEFNKIMLTQSAIPAPRPAGPAPRPVAPSPRHVPVSRPVSRPAEPVTSLPAPDTPLPVTSEPSPAPAQSSPVNQESKSGNGYAKASNRPNSGNGNANASNRPNSINGNAKASNIPNSGKGNANASTGSNSINGNANASTGSNSGNGNANPITPSVNPPASNQVRNGNNRGTNLAAAPVTTAAAAAEEAPAAEEAAPAPEPVAITGGRRNNNRKKNKCNSKKHKKSKKNHSKKQKRKLSKNNRNSSKRV